MPPRKTTAATAATPTKRKNAAGGTKTDTAAKRATPAHGTPVASSVAADKDTEKNTSAKPALAAYRALAPCRVGIFREAGETFAWPRFETCPAHLQEIPAEEHFAAREEAGNRAAVKGGKPFVVTGAGPGGTPGKGTVIGAGAPGPTRLEILSAR